AYNSDASAPLSYAMVGGVVIARLHTLHSVEVHAQASCGGPDVLLRRYDLTYGEDPDLRIRTGSSSSTGFPRLQSVQVFGRDGTTEAGTPIPVATYRYGAATSEPTGHDRLVYVRTQTLSLPGTTLGDRSAKATTEEDPSILPTGPDPSWRRYATWK